MSGPPPKPAAQRRRRNKAPAVVKLPASAPKRTAPKLPTERKFTPRTRAWWRTIWASPMAVVWLDADVPALVRLAALVDRANRGEASPQLLAEIRQLEDRFGLSPLARRRLQWEIEQAQERPPEAKGEEERWLRAVSG